MTGLIGCVVFVPIRGNNRELMRSKWAEPGAALLARWAGPKTGLCMPGRCSPAWPRCCCCPEPLPAAAAASAASPGTSGAWPQGQRSGSGSPVGEERTGQ